MHDGLLPEDDPLVQLPIFEGPLDLLLHLVKLNEVDILNLPMEMITKQYLATLKNMGKLELPLAGEYFVMAADLLRIKSQLLLPRVGYANSTAKPLDASAEEQAAQGPDPRSELVRQLLEYQELKTQSTLLEQKWDEQALSYTCRRGAANPETRPLRPFDRFELMGSYGALMRKVLERVAMGEIALDEYTISQAIENVLENLKATPKSSLSQMMEKGPKSLVWMASMFIAVLELTRLGEIAIAQDDRFADILLEKTDATQTQNTPKE